MKLKNIIYVILMIIFVTFAYLLIDRGVNIKSKINVNYKEDSNVIYRVYLKQNGFYDKEYIGMNQRYIADIVDYIVINFDYKLLYGSYFNGFYKYNVVSNLYVYTDDISDSVWEKQDVLLKDKVKVIDDDDTKDVIVDDRVVVDYKKYKEMLDKFNEDYGLNASGYLEILFKLEQDINFVGIDDLSIDNRVVKIIIPLSYDTFKINVINDNDNMDIYYDFSNKQNINYVLLVLGAFCLAIGISFLALIVRNIFVDYHSENNYRRKLRNILEKYGDIIVEIKKFYNKEKYNLIFVNSFEELIDVYNRVGNPISYREIKRDRKAMFVLVDDDNAWIYEFVAK